MTVWLVHVGGSAEKQVQGLAGFGQALAHDAGCGIKSLVIGDQKAARAFAMHSGVETLHLDLSTESLGAAGMAQRLSLCLKSHGIPTWVLLPHTPWAMVLAPLLAVGLSLPVVAGVVEADLRTRRFKRPVDNGKALLEVEASEGAVLTLAPGASLPYKPVETSGSVTSVQLASGDGQDILPVIQKIFAHNRGESSLLPPASAPIVVAAGRGIGSPESLPLVQRFVDAIPGATLACSRPLVDMGWLPYPCQVGITGATVSAELYIALGISGSTQHLAGIPSSTRVISINTDPNAAIHGISDLIIEADAVDFLQSIIPLM